MVALYPQILRLKRRSTFEKAKSSPAGGRTAVNKVVPWKIVQVTVAASQQETGGNGIGVWGSHAGAGFGVVGTSFNGTGVWGHNQSGGIGVLGEASGGTGGTGVKASGDTGVTATGSDVAVSCCVIPRP